MYTNWKEEKEILNNLINEGVPYEQIGRKYGVSGNAIKKAAKRLGIELVAKRQINPKEHFNKGRHIYVCEKCGDEFVSYKIKKDRRVHCKNCKKKVIHSKNKKDINCIKDLSKRTITKILKRAKQKCAICGWNESTCDIHHIIPTSQSGTNENSNLIIVCPNCHRVIHTTNKYSTDFLENLSIEKLFENWKDYYHPSN